MMTVNDGGHQNLAVALNVVGDIDNDNEPAPEMFRYLELSCIKHSIKYVD